MLSVIHDMVVRNLHILTLEALSANSDKPQKDILRFYNQFDLFAVGKGFHLRGSPLESTDIPRITKRVMSQLATL